MVYKSGEMIDTNIPRKLQDHIHITLASILLERYPDFAFVVANRRYYLYHIQYPFPCSSRCLPRVWDRFSTEITKQSRHCCYKFYLCKLFARAASCAFRPCNKASLLRFEESFSGQTGAKIESAIV